MNHNFPTSKEAMQVWLDGIKYRQEHFDFPYYDEYVYHTQGIAFYAGLIASRLPHMDREKAYICGLLHDYGKKYNERELKIFHGLVGYKELMAMGYDIPARICLTHTFPVKDFNLADFPAYPQDELQECKKLIEDIIYDDYDRLIQFVDKLFEGLNIVPYQDRMKHIQNRYHLDEKIVNALIAEGDMLKAYFDNLCGEDVYKIIGLCK